MLRVHLVDSTSAALVNYHGHLVKLTRRCLNMMIAVLGRQAQYQATRFGAFLAS
jgi:hypothetical protein